MDEIVTKKIICRFTDEDGDRGYLSYVWEDDDGHYNLNTGYDVDDAFDITEFTEDERLEIFIKFQEHHEDYDCELVRITTTVLTEEISDEDDTRLKEFRQRHALNKLSTRDIKILGLGNIATYIKTKFHNA